MSSGRTGNLLFAAVLLATVIAMLLLAREIGLWPFVPESSEVLHGTLQRAIS